jgi:hypothetical protein
VSHRAPTTDPTAIRHLLRLVLAAMIAIVTIRIWIAVLSGH